MRMTAWVPVSVESSLIIFYYRICRVLLTVLKKSIRVAFAKQVG